MLKKQTVWLLTMLSLMIVLSVYYIMIDKEDQQAIIDTNLSENSATSGEGNGNNEGSENDQGLTDNGHNKENNNNSEGNNESESNAPNNSPDNEESDVSDFTNLGKDEMFTMNRMEIQDERSKKIGYLEEVMGSANATTDEKNKALEDIYEIDETNTKEYILQNTIMSKGTTYQDVLVRSDNDMVYVHVMTDELSKSEAVDIMQLVRDEFGEVTVDIKYN